MEIHSPNWSVKLFYSKNWWAELFGRPSNTNWYSKKIGISVDILQNYKKLTEMIPELEELVETGIATPTTALAIGYVVFSRRTLN